MAWTETHSRLQRVLNELDDMNAGVVAFRVEALSETEAAGWLASESRRLAKYVRASGEQY
jgi:hypothetical protein